jgi:hypothetical protein
LQKSKTIPRQTHHHCYLPALFNSRFHCMSCGRNESLDVSGSAFFA